MTEKSVARGRTSGDPGSEPVEVEVRAIASGGDGVAELPDGRVVFVPRTAPGDRALVSVEESRSSWARASIVELLEESERRVDAPCPLFPRCGGCQMQHLPYSEQLHWKGRFVVDALERIGKLSDVPEPEVVPSPQSRGYRTRMTFTLRRLRGGRVVAGLHALDNASHVVDIDDECLLPGEDVLESWTRLRRAWGGGARRLPSGGRLRLTVRKAPGGVELVVDGGDAGWRSGGLMDDLPELVAVWHRPSGEDETTLVAGEPLPGGGDAFEQVNPECAELLRDHVLAVAGAHLAGAPFEDPPGGRGSMAAGTPTGPSQAGEPEVPAGEPEVRAGEPAAVVVEGYCGTASVGRTLASEGARVTGIERNARAVTAARLEAPGSFQVVEGTVEDHLYGALPADLLIVNPPRTGLADAVPGIVLGRRPPRIVYVSCDPATLARDVQRLGEDYALSGLRCFDLFPHTSHVETVAVLDRGEAAA